MAISQPFEYNLDGVEEPAAETIFKSQISKLLENLGLAFFL